jgi:retron-type reverse transcriptase
VTFAAIEEAGAETWLAGLREELVSKTYRPDPVRRVMIPKASPLLANIYMNRFLKHWRLSGAGEAFRAHIVSYADDFVILSRGRAAEALTWTRRALHAGRDA